MTEQPIDILRKAVRTQAQTTEALKLAAAEIPKEGEESLPLTPPPPIRKEQDNGSTTGN